MTAQRLPHDFFRCTGTGCDRKETCLRHVALNDMGPRTPVVAKACGANYGAFDDWYEEVTK